MTLLNCCAKKEKIVVVRDFCNLYEEPLLNKMSEEAWDYYDLLNAKVRISLKDGNDLNSQEELFFAFVMSLSKYESKYNDLCLKE